MTKTSGRTATCLGCGRKLKAKGSVAAQRGPRCRERYEREIEAALNLLAIDLAAEYSEEQVSKATELIEENAILPVATHGVYFTASGDGERSYRTSADWCSCKAGQYGRRCYHRAAATILDVVAEVAA